MSTSQGVNVLRWSALAFGVFYGFYHQSSLTAQAKTNKIQREYQHKQHLIDQARAEYIKKTLPADKKTASGDLITDPNDSRFDLEAFLTTKASE